jgi:hypothetical protein
MKIQIEKLMLAVSATVFLAGGMTAVFAQTPASLPVTQNSKAARKEAKKEARKQARAERKAAHAKNASELRNLEENGYRPTENDLNYPQDLQNAEKKATQPSGASRVYPSQSDGM